MTTLGQLVTLLLSLLATYAPELPICFARSEYKCSPVKVEIRTMTADLRAGWYDHHVEPPGDPANVIVLVIQETTRVQFEESKR